MPRKKLELAQQIEHLSILNENGEIDKKLEPSIPRELLTKLYRSMVLGRRFDERMIHLQRQGRIGTFPPASGHEAASLGTIAHLQPQDWFVPSYREVTAELWRGRSMETILLYNAGFNEGIRITEDQNNLPISIPVGSQLLHAVGIAWGIKYRQQNQLVMTFFGDGATSQGDFHEALNFAGVYELPVVFVCQNNQWAISVPLHKQTRAKTIAQKSIAYGLTGIQVDGNDILAVYAAASEAADRARSGGGPTLIECVTYRLIMHTTSDDPKRYQVPEEVEQWKKRDPLVRFHKYLIQKKILTDKDIETIEAEIKEEIQKSVENAEAEADRLSDPLVMFDHVYEKMPEELKRQKRFLEQEIELEKQRSDR